jgi:hypothetical protein
MSLISETSNLKFPLHCEETPIYENVIVCKCLCSECELAFIAPFEEEKEESFNEIKNVKVKVDRKEWNKTYYSKIKDKLREKYYEKKGLEPPKEKTEKITVRKDGKIKKEFHKVYNDTYASKNKDKVITCECGIDYKFFNKCQHLKSKKHKENMTKK